jgi:hypothetical protein
VVGSAQKWFTIHEYLICVTPFFRNLLQPQRKEIEGDCCICHDSLNSDNKELTYCSTSCGNNFHLACVEDYQGAVPAEDFKCPLCRELLVLPSSWGGAHELPDADIIAFDVYVQWLYKTPFLNLLDSNTASLAYVLGEKLEENDFCRDLLYSFATRYMRAKKCPSTSTVQRVYSETKIDSPMRKLLVNMYAELDHPNLEGGIMNWCDFPPAFQYELVMALARRRYGSPAYTWGDVEAGKARLLSW